MIVTIYLECKLFLKIWRIFKHKPSLLLETSIVSIRSHLDNFEQDIDTVIQDCLLENGNEFYKVAKKDYRDRQLLITSCNKAIMDIKKWYVDDKTFTSLVLEYCKETHVWLLAGDMSGAEANEYVPFLRLLMPRFDPTITQNLSMAQDFIGYQEETFSIELKQVERSYKLRMRRIDEELSNIQEFCGICAAR